MDDSTQQWLGPMLAALIKKDRQEFEHFMESAVDITRGADEHGVNWIQVGRALRDELAWNDYPASPPIDGNRYLEVVRALRGRGVAPTVANIARILESSSNYYEIVAAIETLVDDGKLIESLILDESANQGGGTQHHYFLPPSDFSHPRDE